MAREGVESPVLQARMITFTIGDGEKVRLLTNLLDSTKFSALELATEYHQRWECEIAYRELKSYLTAVTHGKQATTFRSKLADGVLQEAWGMALTYNLIRGLMLDAATRYCEPPVSPLQLSFVDTLEVLKLSVPQFQPGTGSPELVAQLLRRVSACRIDRPRRMRAYPRKVKRKMSNFGLKRCDDKQILRDFASEIRLAG